MVAPFNNCWTSMFVSVFTLSCNKKNCIWNIFQIFQMLFSSYFPDASNIAFVPLYRYVNSCIQYHLQWIIIYLCMQSYQMQTGYEVDLLLKTYSSAVEMAPFHAITWCTQLPPPLLYRRRRAVMWMHGLHKMVVDRYTVYKLW